MPMMVTIVPLKGHVVELYLCFVVQGVDAADTLAIDLSGVMVGVWGGGGCARRILGLSECAYCTHTHTHTHTVTVAMSLMAMSTLSLHA